MLFFPIRANLYFCRMRKLSMDELGRKSVEAFKAADKRSIVVVLDNLRSMHNVGSIFRTADAFLIEAIYLCGYTPRPPHREIQKTALGATESVSWKYFENCVDAVSELRASGFRIYAVEQTSNSLAPEHLSKYNGSIALVLGNEVEGVSSDVIDRCDGCIEIPQDGTKHSLNVAVAAGITLWEVSKAFRNAN